MEAAAPRARPPTSDSSSASDHRGISRSNTPEDGSESLPRSDSTTVEDAAPGNDAVDSAGLVDRALGGARRSVPVAGTSKSAQQHAGDPRQSYARVATPGSEVDRISLYSGPPPHQRHVTDAKPHGPPTLDQETQSAPGPAGAEDAENARKSAERSRSAPLAPASQPSPYPPSPLHGAHSHPHTAAPTSPHLHAPASGARLVSKPFARPEPPLRTPSPYGAGFARWHSHSGYAQTNTHEGYADAWHKAPASTQPYSPSDYAHDARDDRMTQEQQDWHEAVVRSRSAPMPKRALARGSGQLRHSGDFHAPATFPPYGPSPSGNRSRGMAGASVGEHLAHLESRTDSGWDSAEAIRTPDYHRAMAPAAPSDSFHPRYPQDPQGPPSMHEDMHAFVQNTLGQPESGYDHLASAQYLSQPPPPASSYSREYPPSAHQYRSQHENAGEAPEGLGSTSPQVVKRARSDLSSGRYGSPREREAERHGYEGTGEGTGPGKSPLMATSSDPVSNRGREYRQQFPTQGEPYAYMAGAGAAAHPPALPHPQHVHFEKMYHDDREHQFGHGQEPGVDKRQYTAHHGDAPGWAPSPELYGAPRAGSTAPAAEPEVPRAEHPSRGSGSAKKLAFGVEELMVESGPKTDSASPVKGDAPPRHDHQLPPRGYAPSPHHPPPPYHHEQAPHTSAVPHGYYHRPSPSPHTMGPGPGSGQPQPQQPRYDMPRTPQPRHPHPHPHPQPHPQQQQRQSPPQQQRPPATRTSRGGPVSPSVAHALGHSGTPPAGTGPGSIPGVSANTGLSPIAPASSVTGLGSYRGPQSPRFVTSIVGLRACEQCGIRETPQWRRGPDGRISLCNACGLKVLSGEQKEKKNARRRELYILKKKRKQEKGGGATEDSPSPTEEEMSPGAVAEPQAGKAGAKAKKAGATSAAVAAGGKGKSKQRKQPQQAHAN